MKLFFFMKLDYMQKKKGRETRINEIKKGILFYKNRLGLEFEKLIDDSLKIQFCLIDPKNKYKPYSFSIRVDENDQYQVVLCSPKIDYQNHLDQFRLDNNLSNFVKKMRRSFVNTLPK